ncbi:MAG TPA: septum formation initiator family protein, partial [Acidimicrobiia bacterium]
HTRLELLQSENAKLAGESKLLSSDAEIERLARERYGLVKSGEKAFVIVPAPTTTLPPTTLPPTTRPQTTSQSSATTNSGPSRHP